jgi:large repetitive protein
MAIHLHNHTCATPIQEGVAAQCRELIIADGTVANIRSLLDGALIGAIALDASAQPLQAITAALAGEPLETLHLVAHGGSDGFVVGDVLVDVETLRAAAPLLGQWRVERIALWSCGLAVNRAFVELLGALTGAEVLATDQDLGCVDGIPCWQLDASLMSPPFAAATLAVWDHRLAVDLSGKYGWTAIMYGAAKDPVGDSQAGAADTDIVGDANHGSLYTAYDDNGTPTNTADDSIVYRMRIDNPTSVTNFGGVALVGIDANLDGRVDLFMSVDGRNNGQAVRFLEPGTGANLSPSTTSTQALPTGWLPNNGVYAFAPSNYSVVAVSAATDPNWNTDADLGNDGKTDVFVTWRIPMVDLALVLAKPSPVDRNGNYGPRGATGIAGFNKDTTVQYVNFTQTQTGPINGDLNGVGASYDKNATFATLGAFTAPMSASNPVSASSFARFNGPIDANGLINATEDDGIALSGTATANDWVLVTISGALPAAPGRSGHKLSAVPGASTAAT